MKRTRRRHEVALPAVWRGVWRRVPRGAWRRVWPALQWGAVVAIAVAMLARSSPKPPPPTDSMGVRQRLLVAIDDNDVETACRLFAMLPTDEPRVVGGVFRYAALHGRAKVVRQFIDLGADPNGTENDGVSPLMLAAESGDMETLRVLLAAGADVQAADATGETALMVATAAGHLGAVEVLVEAGASCQAVDRAGECAADIARRGGHPELLPVLGRKVP